MDSHERAKAHLLRAIEQGDDADSLTKEQLDDIIPFLLAERKASEELGDEVPSHKIWLGRLPRHVESSIIWYLGFLGREKIRESDSDGSELQEFAHELRAMKRYPR